MDAADTTSIPTAFQALTHQGACHHEQAFQQVMSNFQGLAAMMKIESCVTLLPPQPAPMPEDPPEPVQLTTYLSETPVPTPATYSGEMLELFPPVLPNFQAAAFSHR